MPLTPERAVRRSLALLDAARATGPAAVAVSGGGDSTALLHAAVAAGDRPVIAVTVDHGLRPGSAEEAAGAAAACARLGVPHETLRWDGGGPGNLQERAREARRRLIGAWARERGAAAVLLGHTADDQAETVLLRLARGSGVDGLAGMPARFEAEGVAWDRPFLPLPREALRDWLRARGVPWAEDPSNDDLRFDRARARAMMASLAGLGLTRGRLLRTAGHMARARSALVERAAAVAADEARQEGGDLLLARSLLARVDRDDAAGRVAAAALMWVGGQARRPRWESLRRLAAVVAGGRAATLHGCRAAPEGDWARIAAEGRRAAAAPPAASFAEFLRRTPWTAA